MFQVVMCILCVLVLAVVFVIAKTLLAPSGSEGHMAGVMLIETPTQGPVHSSKPVRIVRAATVEGDVFAPRVSVSGTVHGNITALEKIEILKDGSVTGDLKAPQIAISEDAEFSGRTFLGEVGKIDGEKISG
ncbi:polymer-forming cytoskeletal protein [Candidatus Hydrogenedentota bacterium]